MDLGIQGGDRVCLLADTSPEWTFSDFGIAAAGAVVVPIYPTNSPEECEWVAGNSEARAVICENAAQLDKIRKVKGALPALEHLITIDPDAAGDGVISLEELRERGRGRDAGELEERAAAVKRRRPVHVRLHLRHHRTAEGLRAHARQLRLGLRDDPRAVDGAGRTTWRTCTCRSLTCSPGSWSWRRSTSAPRIAYMAGGTRQIIPELSEVKPTYLPSVPRIFEKLYTLANAQLEKATPEEQEQFHQAVKLGVKVRDMEQRGEPVPDEMRKPFEAADEQIFKNVRALFGGQVREAGTGRRTDRPGDPGVLLRRGHPRARGLRDDRDHGRRHDLDRREPQVRHGRAAVAGNRGRASPTTASC